MMFEGIGLGVFGGALVTFALALTALYLLKLKRQRVEIPFSLLWQRVLRDSQSSALWRKLRRLLSLLVQLVLLSLLLAALTNPHLGSRDRARTVALSIHTSASMQAQDVSQGHGEARTRLDDAKEKARRVVRGLGADSNVLVIAVDGRPTPAGGFSRAGDEIDRRIEGLASTDTRADIVSAFRLAEDALRGTTHPTIILLSDGAYDQAALHKSGLENIDVRFASVGKSDDNLAITSFAARRYPANKRAYEVLVELENAGNSARDVVLELLQEGEVVQSERLSLKPRALDERVYRDLSGEGTHLEAHLRNPNAGALDALPLDDKAYALLPAERALRVLLVSSGNLFLEGALLLDQNITVKKIAPADYSQDALGEFDAVVFDRFTPPQAPPLAALYINPHGDGSPFQIAGDLVSPIITDVAKDHPLLRFVALKDLNISRASRFHLAAGDVAVASAIHDPIIVARKDATKRTVAFGFELQQSDLPLRVAFPLLVVNALDWFAGDDTRLRSSVPAGHAVKLADGSTRVPMKAGFVGELAVNLQSREESCIAPASTLTIDGVTLAAPREEWLPRRELWSSLVLAAMLLSLVEWWTYNRRLTV